MLWGRKKKKSESAAYLAGVSSQRLWLTILTESWHSADIFKPSEAFCSADYLEGVTYYPNFKFLNMLPKVL